MYKCVCVLCVCVQFSSKTTVILFLGGGGGELDPCLGVGVSLGV